MAKKNPNRNRGIIVTVQKEASVKLPLPCTRLHRRLCELLKKAKVRSTEYIFTLQETQSSSPEGSAPVRIENRSDTTLAFKITITLPDGEYFVGSLKAPVKCSPDGLPTELARAAAEINKTGWFEAEAVQTIPKAKALPAILSTHQKLLREMKALVPQLEVQIFGLARDIASFQVKKLEMEKTRQSILAKIELLEGMTPVTSTPNS